MKVADSSEQGEDSDQEEVRSGVDNAAGSVTEEELNQ
jgi:hypothetical protein